jgi:hypothetical protein
MLQMYGQCYQSRYQNAAAASREYCKAISGKTPWARLVINLVQRRNGEDRTQNFRKQSIISVNTNILLRRFTLKFLTIMCSTSCYKERLNFENTLYNTVSDLIFSDKICHLRHEQLLQRKFCNFVRSHRKYKDRYVVIVIINKY